MTKKNSGENINKSKDNIDETLSNDIGDPVSDDSKVVEKSKEIEENEKIIATLNNQIEDYKFTAQRIQAEFENFRRRNEEQKNTIRNDVTNDVIRDFLLVLDSIEAALKIVKEGSAKEGINLIAKQFLAIFSKFEVEEINPVNELFDPKFHNAVMQEENSEKSGLVIQVFQKGYARKGKVIRFATVKVAI